VDERPPGTALALLERAKAGDSDAFGALAEEHRAGLQRLCFKMTGSHEEAEDLVQDTLLKAYVHIAEFELRSSLRTWLYRIATNAALDHQRGKKPWDLEKRWQWFRENGELVKQMEQTLYLSPERSAEVKEVAATCVNCVMMSLPAKQRAAITLCDQAGLSREEAARAIGASVSSVKTELHRARKKMAEVYEHHCALVDEQNECDGCIVAGRVKRRGQPKGTGNGEQGTAGRRRTVDGVRQKVVDRQQATDHGQQSPCADVAELFSEVISGELPEGARERVLAHVDECERCGRQYRSMLRTVRFVRRAGEVEIEPGTPGGVYQEFTSLLALGEPDRAVEVMGTSLAGWPASSEGVKR
jgi:RNA polymerase sigma-70 factor (ECF subfamily)